MWENDFFFWCVIHGGCRDVADGCADGCVAGECQPPLRSPSFCLPVHSYTFRCPGHTWGDCEGRRGWVDGGIALYKKSAGCVKMSYKKSSKFVGVLQEWTGGRHTGYRLNVHHRRGDVEGRTLDTTPCAGIKPQGPHVGDHPRTRWVRGGW